MADLVTTPVIVVFDIDGVVRDVSGSYRRALADTVEQFTGGAYRPTSQAIDALKAEGIWNNDWEASKELVDRYYKSQGKTGNLAAYAEMVAFFQSRYRGPDPEDWTGYICQEPLLMHPAYFAGLTAAQIPWGFFSGATRASANYVLQKRLGLTSPVLVAMEDAPGKPDPTGLLATVQQLETTHHLAANAPVLYLGDTVADLYTVQNAAQLAPTRIWIGIGVLPPHVQMTSGEMTAYTLALEKAGALTVLQRAEELTPALIRQLVQTQ